ncbi:MAG TPA: HNH endonuclease, partial [Bacteroidota bacterium]
DFKAFFSDDLLDHRMRWIGYVSKNILRIATSGRGKSLSVSKYYNAFDLLHTDSDSTSYTVKEPDLIKYEVEEVALNDLKQTIKAFNDKYNNVVPVKRIVVSEQVARPGLISDYLKSLLKYTCQICKQKGFRQQNRSLYAEAHHIMELHKLIPGSYCSDNMIIVCPTCHKKLHYATVHYRLITPELYEIDINGQQHQVMRNVLTR